jgi:hypothetical protein
MRKRIGKLQRQCRQAFWAANVSELPTSALVAWCYVRSPRPLATSVGRRPSPNQATPAANRPFAISTAAKPSPTTPFAIEVAKRGHPETARLRE